MHPKYPTKIGHINPSRALIKAIRKGHPFDFTNGIELSMLPPELLTLVAEKGFQLADSMCLGLHGRGSVLPHTDDVYGNAAVAWLVSDTALTRSTLMMAKGGKNGVLSMDVGDVCVFPSQEYHAWVSRSSWAMIVLDVDTSKRPAS